MNTFKLLLLAAVSYGLFAFTPFALAQVVGVGETARNFTLTHHKTGQPLRLFDYEGSIVVLDFFAYWCGPCQISSPELEKNIAHYYAARGGNPSGVPVVVIGVNLELDSKADTDRFIANTGIGLAGDDLRKEAWRQFNTENAIPLFVIINGHQKASNRKQWEVLYSRAGFSRNSSIASFRKVIDQVQVPAAMVAGDLDVDGQADLLFQTDDGYLGAWLMNGPTRISARFLTPSSSGDRRWRGVISADFNGDQSQDLMFQDAEGTLALWLMNGLATTSASLLNPKHPGNPDWRAVAASDLNQDAKADLLFQHADGTLAVWHMNGASLISSALLDPAHPGDPKWRLAAAGDFNTDGNNDLLLQHADGRLAVWFLNGRKLIRGEFITPSAPNDAQWRVVSALDRNRDGKPDLLFQHRGDGALAVWFMNGTGMTAGTLLSPSIPGGTWKVIAQ